MKAKPRKSARKKCFFQVNDVLEDEELTKAEPHIQEYGLSTRVITSELGLCFYPVTSQD